MIREQFDPMAALIAPHITLVYPFESETPMPALSDHAQSVAQNSRAFQISCDGVSVAEEEYLFLDVVAGAEDLARLHRHLYRGGLQQFAPVTYVPHITLARSTDRSLLNRAFRAASARNFNFTAGVSSISAYWIDPDRPRIAAFDVVLSSAGARNVRD
jgi:2'-5' RNA ligase